MIRLDGLKLASVFAGAQKPFKPSRGLQPLPGADTLHLSKPGLSLSVSTEVTLSATVKPSPAVQTYEALQTVSTAQPTRDEPSMVDRIRASMFAAKGDDAYDARLDLDGNGRVNFADMKRYLEGGEVPAIRPAVPDLAQSRLDRMRVAFFSRAGESAFDPSADLNGDGRVNFADAALLRNGSTGPTRPDEPPAPDTATRMRDAFFATKGDVGFDAALDLNNDGRINFADLRALSQQDLAGDDARPVRPADPADTGPDVDVAISRPLDVPDQVAPEPSDDNVVERVRAAFFANKRDDGFDAGADVNADGRVDFRDLAALRAKE